MRLYEDLFQEAEESAKKEKTVYAQKQYEAYLSRLAKLKPGDAVFFGTHEMPEGVSPYEYHFKVPTQWRVLEADGKSLLVISETLLAWEGVWAFNSETDGDDAAAPWRDSGARSMCRGSFMNDWFTAAEKRMIAESRLETAPNPLGGQRYTAPAGTVTEKLFYLSFEEVLRYFGDGPYDESRVVRDDDYEETYYRMNGDDAAAPMFFVDQDSDKKGYTVEPFWQYWWLRTPGTNDGEGCYVNMAAVTPEGNVFLSGFESGADELGVRPAMRLRLDAPFSDVFIGQEEDEPF